MDKIHKKCLKNHCNLCENNLRKILSKCNSDNPEILEKILKLSTNKISFDGITNLY